MRGPHFSLRWLFGVVSFLAVGCGLLIYATPLLSRLTFTAALGVLLVAVVSAVCRAGERRAFWAGFAAFGFAYVWLICGSWQAPDGTVALREKLVTTELLLWCSEKLPARQTTVAMTPVSVGVSYPAQPGSMGMPSMGGMPGMGGISGGNMMPPAAYVATTTITSAVDLTDFLTTGHSLFALIFALLGGAVARRCFRQTQTARNAQVTAPP